VKEPTEEEWEQIFLGGHSTSHVVSEEEVTVV
jgi:hypothetical protein